MKKTIVSIAAGFLLAGTAATSVSAQSYQIEEGDTLNSIAANHDTTVHSLKDINDLDTNMIFPGDTIDIDDNQDQEQYKVKKGDTLGSISKEFDVSVSDLKEWNDLDSDLIVEGQKLNVQNTGSTDNEEVTNVQENANQEDNQAEADQVAPEEDQEVAEDQDIAEAEQPEADTANNQQAKQEENHQADADQEPAENDQADEDPEAVENEQTNNAPEAVENEQTNKDQEAAESEQANNAQEAAESEQANNAPEAVEEEPAQEEPEGDNASEGKTISVSSTAYTAQCEGCSGQTADGTNLTGDEKVIAVDPDVIPLGSKVHVEGYGDAVAADTGGAINGDKIDVHVPGKGEANAWGNKNVNVTILD